MTERRSHLFLLGLVVAALVAVAAISLPGSPVQREPTLGLDLQGGIEVVLEAQPQSRDDELTEADLDRSVEIIRDRIDKLGVSEPEVRKQGENQIGVQLAGVFNRTRAVEIIGKTAQLQLYDLQDNLITGVSRDLRGFPTPQTSLHGLLTQAKPQAGKGTPSGYYLFNGKKKRVAGPKETRAELLQTPYVKRNFQAGKVPKKHTVLAAPERTRILRCGIEQRYCPGVNEEEPSRTYYYLFRFDPNNKENPVPEMTGNDLELSGTQQDFDPQSSEPIVTMQFTDSGGDKFADITRELAERGQRVANQNGWTSREERQLAFQQFAIVLDDVIQSAPVIDFVENPNGIPAGGGAQITGIGGLQEAEDLELVLQTGALPVRFAIAEQTDVSATLGQDSLRQALIAAVAG